MPVLESARASGTRKTRQERTVVACSILKGMHRWAQPFTNGDTCACGAMRLAVKVGSAAYEVHDE